MLKTISAALLAASVIAAPALAAGTAKTAIKNTSTAQAPVIKADQSRTKVKSSVKTGLSADPRAKAMNANAAIAPSGHHKSVRIHRHHTKSVAAKKAQPSLTKPAATAKRS